MRCVFAEAYDFRRWADSVANAIRLYAGRIDLIPPYALPYILRNPSANIPAADTAPPELVTDWGALVDELNTAITEVFADAPAKMSAYDMPAIIASHAGGVMWDGSFDVTPVGTHLMCAQGNLIIPANKTLLLVFDVSGLTINNPSALPMNFTANLEPYGVPGSITGYGVPSGTFAFSQYTTIETSILIGASGGNKIGTESHYITINWDGFDSISVTGTAKLYYKIV